MIRQLQELGEFYYWPNDGNLGDLLIAEATRQYFRALGLNWKDFDPFNPPDDPEYNLVYGGGGRFTSHYKLPDIYLERFTDSRVKAGIVLPHSFYNVDDFILQAFDERWTIYCREQQSYEYCISLSTKAHIKNGEDMGLLLNVDALAQADIIPSLPTNYTQEELQQLIRLNAGLQKRMTDCMEHASILGMIDGKTRTISFLFRTDNESNKKYKSQVSYDISLAWESSCRPSVYNELFVRLMAETLRSTDVIVTDRLHVGVMGILLNKVVYYLDNDYKKIFNVYQRSLTKLPNVVLSPNGKLTPELKAAWDKVNSPVRHLKRKINDRIWKFKRSISKRTTIKKAKKCF